MRLCKVLLAAAGATVLLSALVSNASARNLSLSNQRIRSSWREVIFELPFINTNCQVTLEGSFHTRTMPKVLGTLMGYITSAILGPCAEGSYTILRETLPWHVRYSGFEPRLPEIRSLIVHIINWAVRIGEPFGIACLARSEPLHPLIGRFHRNPATHELIGVSLGGTMPCSEFTVAFRSSEGSISLQGTTTTRISVSLI
jgi:hypothetical protein